MGPILNRITTPPSARRTVPSVKTISLQDMRDIAAELERVSAPGTAPAARAQVLAWAMQFAGAYYRTARGELRRVFPKGRAAQCFREYEKEKAHAAS